MLIHRQLSDDICIFCNSSAYKYDLQYDNSSPEMFDG